jgi:hypothetical protein
LRKLEIRLINFQREYDKHIEQYHEKAEENIYSYRGKLSPEQALEMKKRLLGGK